MTSLRAFPILQQLFLVLACYGRIIAEPFHDPQPDFTVSLSWRVRMGQEISEERGGGVGFSGECIGK